MERVARHLVVHGRVQGVWFRESCRRQADAIGVGGWVRNTDDGDVEVWLEGSPEAVEAVARWCRRGPSRALVTAVDEEARPPEGHGGFRVAS